MRICIYRLSGISRTLSKTHASARAALSGISGSGPLLFRHTKKKQAAPFCIHTRIVSITCPRAFPVKSTFIASIMEGNERDDDDDDDTSTLERLGSNNALRICPCIIVVYVFMRGLRPFLLKTFPLRTILLPAIRAIIFSVTPSLSPHFRILSFPPTRERPCSSRSP